MPARRLLVKKIREVLRLKHERGLSHRAIAQACAIGVGTVSLYLQKADQVGLGWPLPAELDDAALEARLFRRAAPAHDRVRPPARPQATLEDGLLDAVTAELLLHGRDAPGRRERPHRGGGSDRRAGPLAGRAEPQRREPRPHAPRSQQNASSEPESDLLLQALERGPDQQQLLLAECWVRLARVRLFFVGGPGEVCERHGKSYLTRRKVKYTATTRSLLSECTTRTRRCPAPAAAWCRR